MIDADQREAIRDLLDAGNPQGWNFDEDGEEVIGTCVRTEMGNTDYGPVPILILNVDGGLRSVWLLHTALRNQVQRWIDRGLKPGDVIGIRRLGLRPSSTAGRKDYMDYSVQAMPSGQNALSFAPLGELVEGVVVEEPEVEEGAGEWT